MNTNHPTNARARKIKAALALRGWLVNDLAAKLPKRDWRGTVRRPSRTAVSRAIHRGHCPEVLKLIEQTLGL